MSLFLEFNTNSNFSKEKTYIIDVFCKDFLSIDYNINFDDSLKNFVIENENLKVELPDIFFENFYKNKIEKAPITENFETGLFDDNLAQLPAWFFTSKENNSLPVDILGMAFFVMTGYSDLLFSKKDKHSRDIGTTSFLNINGLIDRPVIQEWFTVLAMKLFNITSLEEFNIRLEYRKHISHDVDQPFEYLNYTFQRLVKRVAGDLILRKQPSIAKQRIKLYLKVKRGEYHLDPFNNFDKLLGILKHKKINSTFFFVTGSNHPNHDVLYDIEHSAIKEIIRKVGTANHTIGIHPSYNTLNHSSLLKKEVDKLRTVCREIGVNQNISSCRKHYLRWDWKSTPNSLFLAGIKHDYTLGYADRSGFRAGVAFAFHAFDWETKSKLGLLLHPLIVMECSLLDINYMNLSFAEAEGKIIHYHNQLTKLGGEFVLLWHNHRLLNPEELELFKKSISL
ncbi:MAG: polysaccharide deacetylase family protein [Balneola sp.]